MSISKFKYYGIIFYKKTHPKPKTLHKPQTTYCPTKKIFKRTRQISKAVLTGQKKISLVNQNSKAFENSLKTKYLPSQIAKHN
jgi:hypothetical protein